VSSFKLARFLVLFDVCQKEQAELARFFGSFGRAAKRTNEQ
jgi:hypothetical protein